MCAVSAAASLSAVREREFPIFEECTYINTASQGPWPTRTKEAVDEVVAACQFPHTARQKALPNYEQIARTRLARLIGADEGDIVFTSNTTHGMNIAAQGIEYRPGDNVVVPQREFPSLSFAFAHLQRRGVEVRFVPYEGAGPSIAAIMARVDGKTRAVACSGIMWDTGYRHDLEALGDACDRAGCLLLVDGIQIVGARQIDVKAAKVSTLATHGYKWLLAGFGIAALYVAPDALDQISPTFVGSQSFDVPADTFDGELNYKAGAHRFSAGGYNRIGMAALATSLGLIEEIGIANIEAHGAALGQYLYDGLARKERIRIVSSPDPAHRAAVIVFTLGSPEQDAAMAQQLEDRGIAIALRPLGMRASPHFYNTEADIDRLLEALPD
jgi:cysteine desulfurase/selenocysteine lyase